MDFFKKLFAPRPSSPEELKKALFMLAERNISQLPELCAANMETILAHFASWRTVPDHIRKDPAALGRYADSLIKIATVFAGNLGHSQLLEQLQGPVEKNPVIKARKLLQECQALLGHLRFEEALSRAEELIAELGPLKGTATESYLPYAYGFSGESLFQTGKIREASSPMLKALALCEQGRDADGVIAYLGNLVEIFRYLGEGREAAGFARKLADELEKQGHMEKAARYRRRAAVFEASEPLNRVVAVYQDREYELEDLPAGVSGHVQFYFERNRITLRRSEFLTGKGEELGSDGSYQKALEYFLEAARLDAYDPRPHYHAGDTYLYLKDYGKALAQFEETERLAPGWYQCRSDIWLAGQLLEKTLDHQDFVELRALDGGGSPQERCAAAEKALARNSRFAPFYDCYGKSLIGAGKLEGARRTFKEGLTCAGEDGVRTRLLCHLSTITEDRDERRRYVEEAGRLNGDLLALAMARVTL